VTSYVLLRRLIVNNERGPLIYSLAILVLLLMLQMCTCRKAITCWALLQL